MSRIACRVLVFFLIGYHSISHAQSWFHRDQQRIILNVDLFMTSTCEHCHDALEFFKQQEDINLHPYFIDQDKKALEQFNQMLRSGIYTEGAFVVPTIFFCNSRWVGFDTPHSMGNTLRHAMDTCRAAIQREGLLPNFVVHTLRQQAFADLNWNRFNIGTPDWIKVIGLGLLDAIAPCSVFALLCLFAFWILKPHAIKTWGLLGALVYILTHLIYQAAPWGYYSLLPYQSYLSVPVAFMIIIGILRFQSPRLNRLLKSIPAGCLQGIGVLQSDRVLLCLSVLFIAVVSWCSQNCTMNLALLLPAAIAHTDLTQTRHMIVYGLYYCSYCAIIGLLWWMALRWKDSMTRYPSLIAASRCFIILTGILLIIKGYGISDWNISLITLLIALGLGLLSGRINEKNS